MKDKEKLIGFPMVKNVPPKTLADDIEPMTAEQVRESMKKLFENFEKMTGYKPMIVTDGNIGLPSTVLVPKENIIKRNK